MDPMTVIVDQIVGMEASAYGTLIGVRRSGQALASMPSASPRPVPDRGQGADRALVGQQS